MEQYIPKSAVVAEIERRLWLLVPKMTFHQQRVELKKLLSFIDTLEVIEIGVDIGSPDGDSGVETIWAGDKIVSNKAQKDKVQKIKEWVKIRKQCTMAAPMKFYYKEAESDYNMLCTIEKILDSLQEEPISRTPADIEAAMQEVKEKSKAFTEAHQGEDADTILAQMRGEEPLSDDLAAEVEKYLEAHIAGDYCIEHDSLKIWGKGIAYYFTDWQKEQMINGALEATVCGVGSGDGEFMKAGEYSVCCDVPRSNIGDKVKLIIIKEENIWKQKKEQ